MDGLSLLFIIGAILIFSVIVYFVITNGYIDRINSRLDEFTGNDEILSPEIRTLLRPVVFRVTNDSPSEFSYRYTISPSRVREVILVTGPVGVIANIDGELLSDVLNETRNKQTLVGYLFPGSDPVTLEVITKGNSTLVIHRGSVPTGQ